MNYTHRLALDEVQNISGSTKAVYLTLLSYCHGTKTSTFAGVGDIANMVGFSTRTVQRALRKLEELGIILTSFRKIRGRTTSNSYEMIHLMQVVEELREKECTDIQDDKVSPQEAMNNSLEEHVKNVDLALPLQKNPNPPESEVKPTPPKKTESVMERWNRLIAAKAIEEANNPDDKTPEPALKPGKTESKAPNSKVEKKKLEFKGNWNSLEKIVEIWEVFTGNNWVKNCENEFINYLSTYCSIARKVKLPDNNKKRIKNPFGYLVMLFKAGLNKEIVRRKDEEKALMVKRDLFRAGLYPQF